MLKKNIIEAFLVFYLIKILYLLQMFHLLPTPQGSFYVNNDIFRLNYA